jgi:dTDP-4-dehydrorhamnose 3,5-epimerase
VRVAASMCFSSPSTCAARTHCLRQWAGVKLCAENKRQMWLPPASATASGCSRTRRFLYKTTDYYALEHERAGAVERD